MTRFPRLYSKGLRGAAATAREELNVVSAQKPPPWPTVRINRAFVMTEIHRLWEDKARLASSLGHMMDKFSIGCPKGSRQAEFTSLPGFGARIALTKTPENCFLEFMDTMKGVACPEPGHEGSEVIVE